MNFDKPWTAFAIDAEFHAFGCNRIVREHNYQIQSLKNDRELLLSALKYAADQLDKLGHERQASIAYNNIAKVEKVNE